MTKNTVLLNLENYNELRDFYNGINEGKFVTVDSYYSRIYYYEEKEVLETLKTKIGKLEKELKTFKKPNEKTIDDVKEMSLLQFLKWRNKRS